MHIELSPQSDLVRTLAALQRGVEKGVDDKQRLKYEKGLRMRWAQTGIAQELREALGRIAPEATSTLPHLAYEWTQNAVEHGARFEGYVTVDVEEEPEAVTVRITDPGQGADHETLKNHQPYAVPHHDALRGQGTAGTRDALDVLFETEKKDDGFVVTLKTTRELLLAKLQQQMHSLSLPTPFNHGK